MPLVRPAPVERSPKTTGAIARLASFLSIVVLGLTIAACSGSADESNGATSSDSVQSRASLLTERLESEQNAVDAVLLALNNGFSSGQIIAGIDNQALQADGSIDGQAAADTPRDFIDVTGTDEAALAPEATGEATVTLVAFQTSSKMTMQMLRERTEQNARLYGGGSYGSSALGFLIDMMSDKGFSAGEVTEMLILGIDEEETLLYGDECPAYRVGQEVFVGVPEVPGDCLRPPGRYPVVDFLTPDDAAAEAATTQPAASGNETAAEGSAPAAEDQIAPPPSVSFSGGATGPPVKPNSTKGEVEPENFFFDATVADGQVEMSIVMTYWLWLRGGYEEVYVDQNCGARLVEELIGTGEAGAETTIGFTVVTSEFIDYTGALCQPGDGDFALSEPGDASKFFLGQADHTGIDGLFGAGIPNAGMQLPLTND